jgi:hypothetical protein
MRHPVEQLIQVGPVTNHPRRDVHRDVVAKALQAPCNRNAFVRPMARAAGDREPLGPGEPLGQLDAPLERKDLELHDLLPCRRHAHARTARHPPGA